MLNTIITAIAVFVATNIDDLFIDTVFFAQADTKAKTRSVILGKYIGIGIITIASCLCAAVLHSVMDKYISLIGIIPVVLGIKIWLGKDSDESTENMHNGKCMFLTIVLVTVSSGGDNIGVYIPVFAAMDMMQFAVTAAVFAVLIALWCALAKKISDFPMVKKILLEYKNFIVPVVLVLLGISILSGAIV